MEHNLEQREYIYSCIHLKGWLPNCLKPAVLHLHTFLSSSSDLVNLYKTKITRQMWHCIPHIRRESIYRERHSTPEGAQADG